ncbi:MAG: helix-turn-helix domain-containing protein [Bacteriovoracaceae bacterium]|nr:helix-turn-helix domain-containing protein [Bacteroidota bacterium]
MGEVLFTTNDIASILRVDKSTIKRWTDEGKLKCFRTPGGHRKFRSEDVYNFMSENNYDSYSMQSLPKIMSDEMIIKSIVHKKEYNVLHSVCFSAAIKGKKEEILTLFTEILDAGLSLSVLLDNILKPTTKKLDHLVTLEKLTVSEFYLAMNVLTSAIIQLNETVKKSPRNHKTIVCASVENGKNETELAALITLLEVNGYTTMNLGSGIGADAIIQFITRTKPFAVCLHTSFSANKEILIKEVQKVAESAIANGSHCIASGNAFTRDNVKDLNQVTLCSSFDDIEEIQFGTMNINSTLSQTTNK